MELVISLLSVAGFNGILLFFIKRFFDRRDKKEADLLKEQKEKDQKCEEDQEKIYEQIRISLETIRLLAYARMSEEIERLLTQGYATPAERRILDEMYHNYKEHGWNGDMDARLEKVYALRTDYS